MLTPDGIKDVLLGWKFAHDNVADYWLRRYVEIKEDLTVETLSMGDDRVLRFNPAGLAQCTTERLLNVADHEWRHWKERHRKVR